MKPRIICGFLTQKQTTCEKKGRKELMNLCKQHYKVYQSQLEYERKWGFRKNKIEKKLNFVFDD